MTNRIDHKDCLHEATSKDRAACRKWHAEREAFVDEILAALPSDDFLHDWCLRGANRFHIDDRPEQGWNRREAAHQLAKYFAPSGDEDRDANRRRNGHTITTSASQIRSIILRAYS